MSDRLEDLLDEIALLAFWRERRTEPPLTLWQKTRYVLYAFKSPYLALSNFRSVHDFLRWWPHNLWQEAKRAKWRMSIFND